jgi:hypothetical protein
MIRAVLSKFEHIGVHLDREPTARVDCQRQRANALEASYAVLHLGECSVFLSDEQLMNLQAGIAAYLASRPLEAGAAECDKCGKDPWECSCGQGAKAAV